MTQKYTIDATHKRLGRLATEVAVLLMGKNTPNFQRNMPGSAEVHITHIDKLEFSPKKQRGKSYTRYSGYPGGIVRQSLEKKLAEGNIRDVLRHAVYHMLPANRLRQNRIKRMILEKN